MGAGSEAQEGGSVCILAANLYCCTSETNMILSPWDFLSKNTGVGSLFFSSEFSQPRDGTQASRIASRLFTI